jgi:predicted oxidoreductase
MWHYVEGIRNWSPIWPRHGIRILPGPSSMWFDATGAPARAVVSRLRHARPAPLHHVDGYYYSWFILTQSIIKKEFALSGSEQP